MFIKTMAGVFGTKGEGSGERVNLIYMDIKWGGVSLWEFEKLYTLREQTYMWQQCTNSEALTSAVVSTLVLKCSDFPLPNRPVPPTQPHILTDGIFVGNGL